MSFTNLKKIAYVLTEKPRLSGQIAFEFLDKVLNSDDILKFTFYGHGINNESLTLLMQMHNDIVILPSNTNEKKFIIGNFIMSEKTKEILCTLSLYPNHLIISKVGSYFEKENNFYFWSIDFDDEMLVFTYNTELIDESMITIIEHELFNKELVYENKKTKNVKHYSYNKTK